ncbi:4-coumarate--CoA ligase [Abeliophyllum distichum]|uniref:4-coumarate--CoA ligase n=1 Tax=Abeliophyllum distichum TaxID=126358 RepID=A0ABD1RUI9_9LAMI
MASGEATEHKLSACCISHQFQKAASEYPEKIAVINASGFAQIAGNFTVITTRTNQSLMTTINLCPAKRRRLLTLCVMKAINASHFPILSPPLRISAVDSGTFLMAQMIHI